jgi:hypothetical protein
VTVAVGEPVQVIASCLENLRGGLNGLNDDEVVHVLRQIEEFSRSTHSVVLDVVAEAEARGIAARTGFGTTVRMLSVMLRVSAAEARTRTDHAGMVGARRTMTGQTLPPRLPATAAAFGSGSDRHRAAEGDRRDHGLNARLDSRARSRARRGGSRQVRR